MAEITISHMDTTPLLLDEFEATSRIKVQRRTMQWATAWSELLVTALYGSGPDVSQIGSTWLGSLCSMNALRPFTPAELHRLHAPAAFLPHLWRTTGIPGDKNVYAIPFTADTRILLYRRDLLAKAGIDEDTAFQTNEHLYETLARLQASGVEVPWAVSTLDEVHHNIAPWVWQAGGDYHTPDGLKLSLADERTIEGIYQFYRLHRFIPPQARGLSITEADALFRSGNAAVVYTVPNTINTLHHYETKKSLIENVGAARVPGTPFVGGSHLVIWKHSMAECEAMEAIHHLTSAQYQKLQQPQLGDLTVRCDLLAEEPYRSDPLYKVSAESLRAGRPIQSVPRWAVVETRLTALLQKLWVTAFADPDLDLKEEIRQRVTDLAVRLEKTVLAA
ncbi:MAG: extracellular solute-binding protein [Chloroflexota bacterium]